VFTVSSLPISQLLLGLSFKMSQVRLMENDLNRYFSKEEVQISNKYFLNAQYFLSSRTCKSKVYLNLSPPS
jgi:hypothetical protein